MQIHDLQTDRHSYNHVDLEVAYICVGIEILTDFMVSHIGIVCPNQTNYTERITRNKRLQTKLAERVFMCIYPPFWGTSQPRKSYHLNTRFQPQQVFGTLLLLNAHKKLVQYYEGLVPSETWHNLTFTIPNWVIYKLLTIIWYEEYGRELEWLCWYVRILDCGNDFF